MSYGLGIKINFIISDFKNNKEFLSKNLYLDNYDFNVLKEEVYAIPNNKEIIKTLESNHFQLFENEIIENLNNKIKEHFFKSGINLDEELVDNCCGEFNITFNKNELHFQTTVENYLYQIDVLEHYNFQM